MDLLMAPAEIKALRLALGMTQAEMAAKLGYGSWVRVSELERGKRNPGPAVRILLGQIKAAAR